MDTVQVLFILLRVFSCNILVGDFSNEDFPESSNISANSRQNFEILENEIILVRVKNPLVLWTAGKAVCETNIKIRYGFLTHVLCTNERGNVLKNGKVVELPIEIEFQAEGGSIEFELATDPQTTNVKYGIEVHQIELESNTTTKSIEKQNTFPVTAGTDREKMVVYFLLLKYIL